MPTFEPEGITVTYAYTEERGHAVTVTTREGEPANFTEIDVVGDKLNATIILALNKPNRRLLVVVRDRVAVRISLSTHCAAQPVITGADIKCSSVEH